LDEVTLFVADISLGAYVQAVVTDDGFDSPMKQFFLL
jgi:hypothetical protein